MRYILTSILALFGTLSLARGKETLKHPPVFYYLPTANENSWLSMECDGKPPFAKIQCRFTQISLLAPSAADQSEAVEKLKAELQKESIESLKKSLTETCAGIPERHKRLSSVKEISTERRSYQDELIKKLGAACDCKRKWTDDGYKDCVIAAMVEGYKVTAATCRLYSQTFELTLERSGERKWINKPGPSGWCNSVSVGVLESEPNHPTLWTFSHTRVSADTNSELCRGLELNKTHVASWKFPSEATVDCKAVKGGLL